MLIRREFLALAPAATALQLAPPENLARASLSLREYYAFLWLEMEAVERKLETDRLCLRTLEAGRRAAEKITLAGTVEDRAAAIVAWRARQVI